MPKITKGIAVGLAAAVMLSLTIAAPEPAAADTKTACAQELGIQPPTDARDAAKKPVILVHGLWSKADDWSKTGMDDALAQIDSANIVEPFDYSNANDKWVTTGDTAQKLAKTIVCYSKLYNDQDITVVAHSMGGLLLRAALDWAAYGTFAKKVTGHIVTIGTPHTGSDIAKLGDDALNRQCNAAFIWWGDEARKNCETNISTWAPAAMASNSKELAELPEFPSDIPVYAIAGEVQREVCAPWGCAPPQSTHGDLIVPVNSAAAEYTTDSAGDGKKVFVCTDPVAIPNISHPWCEHSSMLKSPQVQSDVKASIEAYIASATPKPGTPYEFFGMMTLYLENDLKVQGAHGEGASSYWVECSDTSACPMFSVYSPREVGGDLGWKDWGLPECSAAQNGDTNLSTFGPIVEKGTRQIGNKAAKYYEAELCADGTPRETARFWETTDGNIFIADTSGDNRWQSEEDAILTGTTWK